MAQNPNLWLKNKPLGGMFLGDKVITNIAIGESLCNYIIRPEGSTITNYITANNASLQYKDYDIIYELQQNGYLELKRLVDTFGLILIRDTSSLGLPKNTLLYRLVAYNPYVSNTYMDKDILFKMDIKSSNENNSFTIISTLYTKDDEEIYSYTSSLANTTNPITSSASQSAFSPKFQFKNNGSYYYVGGYAYPFELNGVRYNDKFLPVKLKLFNMYAGTNPLKIWFKSLNYTSGLNIFKNYNLKDLIHTNVT